MKLQSTLPKRVETSMKKIKCDWFGTSIHSTQTGRDTATRDKDTLTFYFNPLYPNG